MTRVFRTLGAAMLFAAFVLQFLVSISLPFLTSLDIVRVHVRAGQTSVDDISGPISELRLGIWGFCVGDLRGDRTCDQTGHGYSVRVEGPKDGQFVDVISLWTIGLAAHPVATAVIFVALLLSFATHLTVTLIASLVSFLAALMTLIAFDIDIALLAFTKLEIDNLAGVRASTSPGPGFWLTFATLFLLLFAGCAVCFGRRRDRRAISALESSKDVASMKSDKIIVPMESDKLVVPIESEKLVVPIESDNGVVLTESDTVVLPTESDNAVVLAEGDKIVLRESDKVIVPVDS